MEWSIDPCATDGTYGSHETDESLVARSISPMTPIRPMKCAHADKQTKPGCTMQLTADYPQGTPSHP